MTRTHQNTQGPEDSYLRVSLFIKHTTLHSLNFYPLDAVSTDLWLPTPWVYQSYEAFVEKSCGRSNVV